ncbi:AsmA family protein, partial [Marinibaculum pumilum]
MPPLAVVLLLAALVAVSHLMPLNMMRPMAQAQLSAALSRPVSLSGDLWIRIGPSVRFVAKGIDVRNPEGSGFPEPEFLTARRVAIDIPLLSLLAGSPNITRAVAAGGDLQFQVRSDGVNNWNLSQTTDTETESTIALPDVLKVKDGRVALIDVPANQTSAIEHLDISLTPRWVAPDGRQVGPGEGLQAGWDLAAEGQILDRKVTLAGQHSAVSPDGVYALDLALQSEFATGTVKGRVFERPVTGFDGRVEARIPSVRQLAHWLQIPLDPAQPDPGSLALEAELAADGKRSALTRGVITGDYATGQAHGSLEAVEGGLRLDGAADLGLLDFDAYLPPPDVETELPTPIANLAIFRAIRQIADLPDTQVPLEWLAGLQGGYGLKVDRAILRALELQNGQACLSVAGGTARLTLVEDNRDQGMAGGPDAEVQAGATGSDAAAAAPSAAEDKADDPCTRPAPSAAASPDGNAAATADASDTSDAGAAADAEQAPPPGTGHLTLVLSRQAGAADAAQVAAAVQLDGAATAMPIGAVPLLFPAKPPANGAAKTKGDARKSDGGKADDGKTAAGEAADGQGADGETGPAAPTVYLTGRTRLETRGVTWLRLAAEIEGRVKAVLSDSAAADAPAAVEAEVQAPGGDEALTATLSLKGQEEKIGLDVTASPLRTILLEDSFTLKAQLQGGLGNGSIDGVVQTRPVPSFRGNADVKSESPGPLLAVVTGDPSLRDYDPGPLALTLAMVEEGEAIEIRQAVLQLGDSRIEAEGRIVPQETTRVSLTVTGSKMDLARLLPPSSGGGGKLPAMPAASLFPQGLDLELHGTFTELRTQDLAFDKVEVKAVVAPAQLSLTGNGTPAGGGTARLELSLTGDGAGTGAATGDDDDGDAGQAAAQRRSVTAEGKLDLEAEASRLKQLFRAEAGDGASGSGSLKAAFRTDGDSLPALMHGLTGTASVTIKNMQGELHPIDELSASLDAGPDATSLTVDARFPKPQLGADDAIAIVARKRGETAVTNNPVHGELRCKGHLWHCLAAGEVPAELSLVSGDSRLDLDGRAAFREAPGQVSGRLSFAGKRLSDWDGLVGDALPQYGPYKLTADVVLTPHRQTFSDLALTVANSDFAGRLDMRWRDKRPWLDANLKSKHLNTEDFGSQNVEGQQFAEKVRVPTGWLDWVRGKAQLAVGEMKIQHGFTMNDVDTALESDGRRLQVHRYRAGLIGGQFDATGSLQGAAKDAAAVDMQGSLKEADVSKVAARLGEPDIVSGALDAVVKLRSQGTTLDDLVGRPTGEYFVRIDKGHISNDALGLLSVKFADIFSPLFGSTSQTDLNCLQSQGTAKAGDLQVPEMRLDTSIFQVHGEGQLSMPKQSIDMDFRMFGSRVSVASLAPAFSVTGKLSDPDISFNAAETALDLAPSLLGSLAGEVASIVKGVTGAGDKGSVGSGCP